MELGVHLPLIQFGDDALDDEGLRRYVRRASELGFSTLAANDHLVFGRPWFDGLVALAAVVVESGTMRLATTLGLPVVRGPAAFATATAAIDRLSGGRLVVGVGPGSSKADHELVGLDFDERWARLDEAIPMVRALWSGGTFTGRYYSTAGSTPALPPAPAGGPPVWIGSWGSPAGLRRVARLGDGWLASAYNTTAAGFAERKALLDELLRGAGRDPASFPNALATMFLCVTDTEAEAAAVLRSRVRPAIPRPEEELRERLLIGPADELVAKLVALRDAGVDEVLLWPVVDEAAQLERFCAEVRPLVQDR